MRQRLLQAVRRALSLSLHHACISPEVLRWQRQLPVVEGLELDRPRVAAQARAVADVLASEQVGDVPVTAGQVVRPREIPLGGDVAAVALDVGAVRLAAADAAGGDATSAAMMMMMMMMMEGAWHGQMVS